MKFSIITPAYNMEPWVAHTIESIISQEGDFEIEYIFADGGSKDRTVAIFEEYRKKVENGEWPVKCKKITMNSFSEKDDGTFDAINKGFARATGEVITWADGDNTFEPGAFRTIASTFETFPQTEWVIAVGDTINDRWEKIGHGMCLLYNQQWLREGVYGREAYFVVQNGCFWRRELWAKVGPIPTTFKVAGDYWLWSKMAKYAAPLSIDVHISNFMKRQGQLHTDNRYRKEQEQTRPQRGFHAWRARIFFWPYNHLFGKHPFFASLYPLFYPFQSREYVSFENGVPVKKVMRSFFP
jgi:glycosyltransferase involved in cell wall biosynthesis